MNVYDGNEKYIFVSYAHKDSKTVLPIVRTLQKKGFRIWCDEELIVGENYNAAIARRLRDCAAVLFFLSDNWMASKYCRNEATAAIEQFDKKVALLYMEDCTVHDEVLMLFIGKHAVRKSDPLFIEKLKKSPALTECIGIGSADKSDASPSSDKKRLETLRFIPINDGECYSVSSTACTAAEIVIPESYMGKPVTRIPSWAFQNASALRSIKIPNSITSIENEAFYGCSSLESIHIPCNVKSIGEQAFVGCSSLKSITVDEQNTDYSSIDSNLYTKDGKTLLFRAPAANGNSFDLPCGVMRIAEYAFGNNTALERIGLPESLYSIENNAFYGCTALKSITIPSGVNNIGSRAFTKCTQLSCFNVSEENSVFSSIGAHIYSKDKSTLIKYAPAASDKSFTVPSSVTDIEHLAFDGTCHLESVVLPSSLTRIGECAFFYCESLKSIVIPDTVTEIEHDAFCGCQALKEISLPKKMTRIRDGAFSNCTSLESISVPNGITYIDYKVFSGCKSLRSVTLPGSIKQIDMSAFRDCSSLEDIYYSGMKHNWSKIRLGHGWNRDTKKITVHCFLGSIKL